MSKKVIAILLGIGAGLGIIGLVMFIPGVVIINSACQPNCTTSGQVAPIGPSLVMLGGLVLFLVGYIVGAVAWVGALVRQGKRQQWGWFAGTLASGLAAGVLTSICMLIYLIVVPERQEPLPNYLPMQPYQAGVPSYFPASAYQPGEQYQIVDPYQAAPQYPPVDPYQAPPQYPPQG